MVVTVVASYPETKPTRPQSTGDRAALAAHGPSSTSSWVRSAWLMLLVLPSVVSAAPQLRGRVVAVLDGDTITVLDSDRRQHRVRLHQIDAPEKDQDFGAAAKKSLSQMIYRRDVAVATVTTDRYRREVGTVYLAGADINLEQIRRGMAWVYRRYSHDAGYLAAEQSARASRIGLWARAKPIPPWEFRHEQHGESGFSISRWLRRFR